MKYFVVALWLLWSGLLWGQTLVDDADRRLTLSGPAQRIVTLAPHLTELIYAIGAESQLVGVSAYSDYPPAAQSLPRLSDHAHIDFERLQRLRPDMVLAWGSGNRANDIQRLRDLDVPVYVSEPRRLEDVASTVRDLGVLTGHTQRADALAQAYLRDLAQLRARYIDQPPLRVFYQIADRPLMTVNGTHLISQALGVCRATNVFAKLPVLAPNVSQEAVLLADPDVIVLGAQDADAQAGMAMWRARSHMRAVRNGALHTVSADLLHRATPRLLTGIEQLCVAVRSTAVDGIDRDTSNAIE